MGVLQDPIESIKQVEWYSENVKEEKFPGAFELAAGNLCRQILEQILFILCFFSKMPPSQYLRADRTLKTAGQLINALNSTDPGTGKKYIEMARKAGPRIRKFAQFQHHLRVWARRLNEPSHYSTKFRSVDWVTIRKFIAIVSKIFDSHDKCLLVAIINDIFSNGRITALLSTDPQNSPAVQIKSVITANCINRHENGGFKLTTPKFEMKIISSTEIPRGAWSRKLVLIQHSTGMAIQGQLIASDGKPINLKSLEKVLQSLSRTKGQRAALSRRFNQFGLKIQFQK